MILSPGEREGGREGGRGGVSKRGSKPRREGGRNIKGERRRTSLLVVAHEVFTHANFVGVHEVQHFAHFLLVPALVFVRD